MAMSKTYKLVESTDQATHYYIVPQHQTLIPKCQNSQRVLITLLSSKHDIHSPTMVGDYPLITRQQANMFGWIALTVKVHYIKHLHIDDCKEIAIKAMRQKEADFQAYLNSIGIDPASL